MSTCCAIGALLNKRLLDVRLSHLSCGIDVAGVIDGKLHLSADVLAGIYICDITSWADIRLAALNQGLR